MCFPLCDAQIFELECVFAATQCQHCAYEWPPDSAECLIGIINLLYRDRPRASVSENYRLL